MKKALALLVVAGTLLSVAPISAEDNCMDFAKQTKEIYTTLPLKLKRGASKASGSFGSAYISSYCEAAAKSLKQQYGDIAGNMQALLLSKNLNATMVRGVSNDSLCGNVFYTLIGMAPQEITNFWLILSTFVPNEFAELDDSYAGFFSNDIAYRLTYVPQNEGDVMKVIAYAIATIDDNAKDNKIFWHPMKLHMLIDLMRGKDITAYTHSRFGDFLNLSFDATIKMCEARIGKDGFEALASSLKAYEEVNKKMTDKGYIMSAQSTKQTAYEKKPATTNSSGNKGKAAKIN